MDNPLPCAHCVAPAKLEQDKESGRWAVYCTYKWCAICTPLCSTPEFAIKYWNRRDWKPGMDAVASPGAAS